MDEPAACKLKGKKQGSKPALEPTLDRTQKQPEAKGP